jgi:hypothetical protein
MSPEDCKPMERVVVQRLILAPNSPLRNTTRNDAEAGHAKEQHRCAKARDVRRGPLEDDPARVRGFVLTRSNKAHRGYSEEHGHRQHHKPLAEGNDWQSEWFRQQHVEVLQVLHIAKYTSTSSTTFIESTGANLRHPFKFGCMVSRGWGENEQLVISATALVHP